MTPTKNIYRPIKPTEQIEYLIKVKQDTIHKRCSDGKMHTGSSIVCIEASCRNAVTESREQRVCREHGCTRSAHVAFTVRNLCRGSELVGEKTGVPNEPTAAL